MRNIALVLFGLLTVNSFPALAASPSNLADDICGLPDVYSTQMSVRSGDPEMFTYRYRFIKSQNSDAPIVIFIPGGPGQNSMTRQDPRVSDSYSLVLTDPRGEGCNSSDKILATDISSEKIANDIVSLVKALNPKQKYIIHGFSAGTMVATIVSAKIASENIAQPSAIFLEGVVGRHYSVEKNGFGLAGSWAKILPHLDPATKKALETSEGNPYGAKEGNWTATLQFVTFIGAVRWLGLSYDNVLDLAVHTFGSGQTPSKNFLTLTQIGTYNGAPPSSGKVYGSILCNEITDEIQSWMTYANGVIGRRDPKMCATPMNSPFDSSQWQMKHKTIYFVGESDPNTPPYLARYHFLHQKNKNKLAVIVKEAGHMSLQINLRDCLSDLIANADSDPSTFTNALGKCAAGTQVY